MGQAGDLGIVTRAKPGAPRGAGRGGADFARGRGARGAGQRPRLSPERPYQPWRIAGVVTRPRANPFACLAPVRGPLATRSYAPRAVPWCGRSAAVALRTEGRVGGWRLWSAPPRNGPCDLQVATVRSQHTPCRRCPSPAEPADDGLPVALPLLRPWWGRGGFLRRRRVNLVLSALPGWSGKEPIEHTSCLLATNCAVFQ